MSRIRDHFICKLHYAKDDCNRYTDIMTLISLYVDVTKCLSDANLNQNPTQAGVS